uniref:Uncharacterized protein n=1 Tax=Oryza brachyantha TaxID=4533 RepID=J3LHS0_ORYBR
MSGLYRMPVEEKLQNDRTRLGRNGAVTFSIICQSTHLRHGSIPQMFGVYLGTLML